MCVYFKWLVRWDESIPRNGYCVKLKCYTNDNDPIAETCEHFVLVGTQESKRSK
jgi:hypothetical protein